MGTIDYMICAYGPYSASAAGGNGWSRDFLAGILTVPATPFYESMSLKKVSVHLILHFADSAPSSRYWWQISLGICINDFV